MTIDGRSFLPQLRGEKGEPREWVYSWYSPRQLPNTSMTVRELAFTDRYKLYRTGEFFDLGKDADEKEPLSVASLSGEAAAAAKLLQKALDQYHRHAACGARPQIRASDRRQHEVMDGGPSRENEIKQRMSHGKK